MVKLCDAPIQPLADGVTVILADIGATPVFIARKEAILPVPDAERSMAVLLFVQW
jgi:hypothetical protein